MARQTTPSQRRSFFVRHLQGETYQQIADSHAVSKECVRYWCRRQRDGGYCHTRYRRQSSGLLSRFDPLVRYCVLRLRLEHPRWGPNRIRARLKKHPGLRQIALPSEASIGRYLHQWSCFHRKRSQKPKRERPKVATEVHQQWQIDFKIEIPLKNGTLITLHTVRDPVGEAVIGAYVFPAGKVGRKGSRVTVEQVRYVLRSCFARWNTMPDQVQTDGEPALIGRPNDSLPSPFTLWLKGLGIEHQVIRSRSPTDNSEVERCHRTVNDYGIVGNEGREVEELQQLLDYAVYELNYELTSRAEGCGGRPPIEAHPELLQPRRSFRADHELALFSLPVVDAHLSTFTWERKVSQTGQITMGGQKKRYSVGRQYAGRQVLVRFDPTDRNYVFYDSIAEETEIGRRPARDLEVMDLTGIAMWPEGLGLQQLPLPLIFTQG